MKKIFFQVSCGIGMDSSTVEEFEYDLTDEELNQIAYDMSCENAESFGSLWDEETAYELQEKDEWGCRDFTYADLDYKWEVYDPKKHDRYRAGGGSFLDDFEY